MIGARIRCDHCGFIGEMEMSRVSKSTVTAPSGWATVSAMVRIKGDRELSTAQNRDLRAKIKAKTPPFHVCPQCIYGSWEVKLDRLLSGPKEAAC